MKIAWDRRLAIASGDVQCADGMVVSPTSARSAT
jgi:hypothetical protein